MIRVGTCGFGYDDWSGTFYPKELQSINFLGYYSKFFDTVEIDATFYSLPKFETVKRWHDVTPDDFRFSVKMPRKISNDRMLLNAQEETKYFLSVLRPLRHKLAYVLIQLPLRFTNPQYFERLRHYLLTLPPEIPFAVEFTSPTWDTEGTFQLLRDTKKTFVWHVHPDKQPILCHTSPIGYVRFVGSKDEPRDIDQNEKYFRVRKEVARFGFDDVYIFVNNYFEGFSPASAVKIKEAFGMDHTPWPQQAQKDLGAFTA